MRCWRRAASRQSATSTAPTCCPPSRRAASAPGGGGEARGRQPPAAARCAAGPAPRLRTRHPARARTALCPASTLLAPPSSPARLSPTSSSTTCTWTTLGGRTRRRACLTSAQGWLEEARVVWMWRKTPPRWRLLRAVLRVQHFAAGSSCGRPACSAPPTPPPSRRYGDDTCLLAYCCAVRCPNTPHAWQLGWISLQQLTEAQLGPGQAASLTIYSQSVQVSRRRRLKTNQTNKHALAAAAAAAAATAAAASPVVAAPVA